MSTMKPGSFLMIPAACLEACKTDSIKNGDIAILAAIAKFTDNTSKECWPSVETLCETAGISRPTVIKALERLTGAGLLQSISPPNYGKGKATRRKLVFSEPSKPSGSTKLQESSFEIGSSEESAVTDKAEGLKNLEKIKKNIGI
jgi:DNA-binding GntR family transcriptional regulator